MEVSVFEYLFRLKLPDSGFNNFDWLSWKHYFRTAYDLSYCYVEERLIIFITGVLGYFIACFFAYYFIVFYLKSNSYLHHIESCKRVLVVTAHPDDECMFFGPVIIELIKNSCEVHVLCLCPGNYEGKGSIRKQEFWKSCHILGIPDSNISLCRNSLLPDDPNKRWKKSVLGPIILSHIEMLECDTVITFDQYGISGHLNHCAIFASVCDLIDSNKLSPNCKVYFLETINLFRKYSSFADFFLSFMFSSCWYSLSFEETRRLKAAMKAHESQYVWFRKLYMLFSRYVFINTLRPSDSLDLNIYFDFED